MNLLRKFLGPVANGKTKRIVEVGWALISDKNSVIWNEPRQFSRTLPKPTSAKSLQVCPAAIDFDARHYTIPCPVDLHLRFRFDEQGKPALINVAGEKSTIRAKHLNQMVTLVNRNEWRHPERPILQIVTPYIFLADNPVWINQLPSFLDYAEPAWPGILISGRFPIHIWPRQLMWAFEWHDISKDFVIKRGQPWFYVRFETETPLQQIRLIEATITPEVSRYLDSISGVTNYVNQTFSLFETAERRRPKNLLIRAPQ